MAKVQEKLQAQALRKQGRSIKDIAIALGVSKGSVSTWCSEITLTSTQANLLKQKQIKAGTVGRQKGAEANRQRRLDIIEQEGFKAKTRVGHITKRDLLILGVGLYWGEGVKSKSGPASIVNSDPTLLLISKRWFEECLLVPSEEFQPYIYISESHRSRSKRIVSYWSSVLDIPKQQFHNPIIIKQKPIKRYANHQDYYGVVALRVRKSSRLKYHIQGLISAVAS